MPNVALKFTHTYDLYCKDMVAHFPRHIADQILSKGVAVLNKEQPVQDEPLPKRTANKSVTEK